MGPSWKTFLTLLNQDCQTQFGLWIIYTAQKKIKEHFENKSGKKQNK